MIIIVVAAIVVGVLVLFMAWPRSGKPKDGATPASSTTSRLSTPQVTWVGTGTDGQRIVIVDDGGNTSFDSTANGRVPSPIALIDKFAADNDCGALQSEMTFWLGMGDDETSGRAGAYANHAKAAGETAGCSWAKRS